MPHFVALLRGINVGGRNKVSMSELRAMAEALALRKVRTLLQSGNLVFEAAAKSSAAWEKVLEQATQERFGLAIDYCVRSGAEWTKIVEGNPFSKETAQNPAHVVVMCLKHVPKPDWIRKRREAINGPERVEAKGRELYLVYPAGIGTSKLTNSVIERALGVRGTARNWNTVMKLHRLIFSPPEPN